MERRTSSAGWGNSSARLGSIFGSRTPGKALVAAARFLSSIAFMSPELMPSGMFKTALWRKFQMWVASGFNTRDER
eukprot:CAMPEP_0195028826 /NCGR_PEP_ID=MMETSP0326_2-20130528/55278_1 /TAXON_ID=2866 ORGANISM="Crypthecodinium cohnii, Strain Seligo" /NCGR_SAMPLE_ID=MMETSP0326_2 /ASSEMBLY_ACC=CAM_ASM_000348 /LENGTH=75 /DNA_ID=CAMNT_0040051493 /DNA_START=122 /DNA_END=349 /DNA_ORIENTATION=-